MRVMLVCIASSALWGCGGASSPAGEKDGAAGQGGVRGDGARPGTGGDSTAGEGGTQLGSSGNDAGGDGGFSGRTDGGSSGRIDGGTGGGGTGGYGFAEHCDCEVAFGEATCRVGATDFQTMFPIPSDCERDLDYATVSTCADGTRRYSWVEGSENDYDVVVDADSGAFLYGRASGYVTSACEVSGAQYGTISYGVQPETSTCTTTDICRNDGHAGTSGQGGNAG